MSELTHLSLFSGIGGLALAALCGFEILNWVKIRVIRTGNEY